VLAGCFKRGENVFVADRYTLWIDVGVSALDVESGDHFFNIFRHEKGMGFTGRLIRKAAFGCDPIMLQVIPAPLEHDGMSAAGVAMAGQHAGLAYAEQVDVVTASDAQQQWLEGHGRLVRAVNSAFSRCQPPPPK